MVVRKREPRRRELHSTISTVGPQCKGLMIEAWFICFVTRWFFSADCKSMSLCRYTLEKNCFRALRVRWSEEDPHWQTPYFTWRCCAYEWWQIGSSGIWALKSGGVCFCQMSLDQSVTAFLPHASMQSNESERRIGHKFRLFGEQCFNFHINHKTYHHHPVERGPKTTASHFHYIKTFHPRASGVVGLDDDGAVTRW